MRETYEYAVVDVESLRVYDDKTSSNQIQSAGRIDGETLQTALSRLGVDGFRIVTTIEDMNGIFILMSKAVSKK